jgi:diguanylate cyclase (GGDEF)-like protein
VTSFPFYDFSQPFDDARLAELRLLSFADRHGGLAFADVAEGPWRDFLIFAVADGLLSAFGYEFAKRHFGHESAPWGNISNTSGIAGESQLERAMVIERVQALDRIYQRTSGTLFMTHRGRVRLSELKQALRSGREREPFGILWDGRYAELDLQIMLLDASTKAPLSVVFMDMNGLKSLNDTHGHEAGNQGLRAYFESVSTAVQDAGQAYRLGGDEVLALIPKHDKASAARLIETACRLLMNERVKVNEEPIAITLSIAAGIVDVIDPSSAPADVRQRSDHEQYRAKSDSKKVTPRPSVIAIEGEAVRVVGSTASS